MRIYYSQTEIYCKFHLLQLFVYLPIKNVFFAVQFCLTIISRNSSFFLAGIAIALTQNIDIMTTDSTQNNCASHPYRWVSGLLCPLFVPSLLPLAWETGNMLTFTFVLFLLVLLLIYVGLLIARKQLSSFNNSWINVCTLLLFLYFIPLARNSDSTFTMICLVIWGVWLFIHYGIVLFYWKKNLGKYHPKA